MSHIPSSAMPHAGPSEESQQDQGGGTLASAIGERAGKVAEYARENPKTAIAAGAALAAGAIAAAAIPLVRGRSKSSEGGSKSGGRVKSGGKAKAKS